MRFVVVRHGQSANNQLLQDTGALVGRHVDPRLTDVGHQQARLLAQAVLTWPTRWRPTHIYTSLMLRAVETAAAVSSATRLTLEGLVDLAECGGPFVEGPERSRAAHPGAPRQELLAVHPTLVLPDGCRDDGWWPQAYEGDETLWGRRAAAVIAGLRERHDDDDVVLLVSHEGLVQRLLRSLLGIPDMTGWFGIYNTGVCRLWDEKGRLAGTTTADCVNSTAHLPAELVTD